MNKLSNLYTWVMAAWLVVTTAAAFLLLAHALQHGQVTLF
jgi:type VI protein secretion system component VasF